MVDNAKLAETCRETAGHARGAIEWFETPANQATIGPERPVLTREFRRFTTTARKLEAAVERPMCVGVFGPSQAGKSYLVSVLAAPSDRPLRSVFEGEAKDFIRDINPVGEKESTGLVTRFSIRAQPHPPGHPVCLRLLSAADIIKIIGNTFFLDGDLKAEPLPTAERIDAVLARARAAAGAERPGLSDEDVWDIQEYFEQQFAGVPYLGALASFWDEASALAPKLEGEARTELFSLLWGSHERFSYLARTLLAALERLGHAAEAFCPIEALVPREKSIIDVATLAGLGHGNQEQLAIRSFSGSPVQLPRPVIAALTAELRIVMAEQPWPFFTDTDLLDFPGARSRQPLPLAEFLEKEDALKETFLRGKVAYLFDRYVAEQELTSMLLCIPPSNLEVTTLPAMIDHWIALSHGPTAAERAGKPCVLFFVLTKFDTHFVEKAGGDAKDPGVRFKNRMEASLTGSFGKAHDWPDDWTPGKPFANCYWLRNPNYPAETIIVYEDDPANPKRKREVEVRADRVDYLSNLRASCLGVGAVRTHFQDAGRAWDEALKLNDGGVGYLAESLAPVCNPALKQSQVQSRLMTLRAQMAERLKRFYVSDDLEERLEQRLAVAGKVVEELYGTADLGRFGHLIRALQVPADELADVLYRVEAQPPDDTVIVSRSQASAARRPRPLPTGLPRSGPGEAGSGNGASGSPVSGAMIARTREELLAEAALKHWMERLHRVPQNARLCHSLRLESTSLAELTSELIGGSKRRQVAHQVSASVRRFTYIERSNPAKPALLAATLINRFVAQLGFDRDPLEQRPQVADGELSRPVFAPRPVCHDGRGLGAEPLAYTDTFITDWVFAFVQLVRDNATQSQGQTVDLEQNLRIGQLVKGLQGGAAHG